MNEDLRRHLEELDNDPESESAFSGLEDVLTGDDVAVKDPDTPVELEKKRRRLSDMGEWEAVARLLELELLVAGEVGEEDREVVLTFELAQCYLDKLHTQEAGRKYLEKVLALDPHHAEALRTHEEILAVIEKWQEIVDRFSDEAAQATEPSLKTSLFYRAAEVLFRNNPEARDEAKALLEQSLEADPRNQQSINLLGLILRKQERWKDVGDLFFKASESAHAKEDRLRYQKAAARLYATKAHDAEAAAKLFRQILEVNPGHPGALAFLADFYDREGKWEELVDLYEDALKGHPHGVDEQAMLLQIGMIHWRKRNDAEAAEEYFQRLRKVNPTHEGMLQFFREHSTSKGDSNRLLQVLNEAQRTSREGMDKLDLAKEIARVAESQAKNPAKTIDAWKQVQRIAPSDVEARDALRRLYEAAEQWNALLDLLKSDIDALPEDDVQGRVAAMRRMVAIYRDKLSHDPMVINTYNSILRIDPDNAEALEALSKVYDNLGRYSDLTRVLERRAKLAEDTDEKIALLSQVAKLWVDRFNNLNKAVEPLEQVLELDPGNPEALSHLKAIYGKRRAWKPLYEVIRREADTAEGAEKVERLSELAKLAAERLDKPAEAIHLWEQVYEADPTQVAVLDELEHLTERQRDWEGLARVLERRLENAADDDIVQMLIKLGTVYGDRLLDPARSAEKWRQVLERQPGHPKAVRVLKEAYVKTRNIVALEELYGGLGDWEGLVEVLSSTADKAEDLETKVELSFKAAAIYEEKIEQPARAQRSYERVLTVDADNIRAATALLGIYTEGGQWSRLLGVRKVLLGHSKPGSDEQLEHLVKLRDLCADKLGERAEAFRWAAQAYEVAPLKAELREALEERAGEVDAWEELLAIYERRAAATDDTVERLDLLRRVARLSADVLGRPEDAVASYKKVLELAPGDDEALATLERIYAGSNQYRELLGVFQTRLEGTDEPERRRELLKEIARIREEGLEDADGAAAAYRDVLKLQPDDSVALAALERMANESERWTELSEILEARRKYAEGPETQAITFQLASLLSAKLSKPARAVDELESVLKVDPGNSAALDALEPFLDDAELRGRVATLMEPHLQQVEDYVRLARVLSIILESIEDAETRVEVHKRLAAVQVEQLQEHALGMASLGAALRLAPGDRELWDRLDPLAEFTDSNQKLAEMLAAAFNAEGLDATLRMELAERLADIYDMRLSNPEEAKQYHQFVLEREPSSSRAFEALESLFSSTERWDDLLGLYRNQSDRLADPALKRALLLKVCFIFEEVLEKPDQAIEWYVKVLDLDPDDERANVSLEALYAQTERWAELARLLETKLGRAEGEAGLSARYRLGDLYETRLKDLATALDYHEQVLQIDARHEGAQAALERLLVNPDLRQRAAAILEPIYADHGASAELVRVLEVQLEVVGDPSGQVEILSRIGTLLERDLEKPLEAFDAFARAFAALPSSPGPRDELRRLAASQGLQARYCQVLESGVERVETDVSLTCDLLAEVAKLYEEQLDDPTKAENAYRRLLNADPENTETALPAAKALESLYLLAENWTKLVDILRLRAGFAEQADERRELLARVAEILEVYLGQPAGAIDTYREILDIAPTDLTALHHLERLFERTAAWTDLVGVLRRRIELSTEKDEQRELHFRIANLYEERLASVDDALLIYHTIQNDLGPNRDATRSLVRLYEQSSRWIDLLDALEVDLQLCSDPPERAELLCRMGNLLWKKLDEPGRAVDKYREVVSVDPNHLDSRNALEAMLGVDQVKLEAAQVLAPLYESEGSWEKLVSVLELQAGEATASVERWEKLREAAEVAEVGLEDSSRAFEIIARALREGAGEPYANEVVDNIERLAIATGKHGDLVELYKLVSPDILDGTLQLHVMLHIAGTAHHELNDFDLAREFYVKILDSFGDHVQAMDALEDIYRTTGAHTALLEIYRRKTNLATAEDDRRRLLMLQAELCETSLNDLPESMHAYEAILDMGEDRTAIESLERLYAQAERHNDLSALLERQLGSASPQESVTLHYRLGELHRNQLSEPDTAIDHYRSALEGNPRHGATVVALEALMSDADRRSIVAEMLQPYYKAEMDWPKLVGCIEARLDATPDPLERKPLLLEMGEIYELQMEDLEKAFDTYARMFRDDIEDSKSRDQLSRLADVLDVWPKLAEIYFESLKDVLADTEGTAELAFVLGKIYDDRCGQPEKARDAFRRVLTFDPEREAAFRALENLFQRTGAWRDQLELYREAADRSADVSDRKDFLFKMAVVQEEMLEDASAAIELYREVLDADEQDSRAIGALDRLYRTQERWADLAELFMRRIDLRASEPREQNELRCQLGEVYQRRLDDLNSAIDCYEKVLEGDPDHVDALQALQKLVMNEDHRFRIAKILEPIYEMKDDWMRLVIIYDAELEFIEAKEERVKLRRQIARLHEERGGDTSIAFKALAAAFSEEPENDEILISLQRLAEQRGAWDDFVAALEAGLKTTYDTERQAELLRLVARTHDRRLGDPRAAIDGFKRLLEVDDRDVESLDSLEGLYTLVGDWNGQIETLERKAEMAATPDARKDLLHRVGAIFEDMVGDTEKAIDAYRRAFVEDDSDRDTISALERLYTESRQWNELIDVLRRQLDLESDVDARVSILHRIAEVFDQETKDAFEATNAYQAVLGEAPDDKAALDALDRLHEQARRWPELLEVLLKKAELATQETELINLWLRVGALQEKEMLDLDQAIATFSNVLGLLPDNEEALSALERIARDDSHRFAAAEVLEPLLRKAGAWTRLSALKELKLEAMLDVGERVLELRSLADIAEEGMGDPRGAFKAQVRALAEDPSDEVTHEHLERLAAQLGAWKDLAAAYESRAAQIYDADQVHSLNVRLGRINEEQLGASRAAIEAYRKALDAGGDESIPLAALDRLYLREEQWQELAEVIEREMRVATDEAAGDLLEYRLGSLREEKFKDLPAAISSFRTIVERNPDHGEAIEALERLLKHEATCRDVIDVLDPLYRQRGDNAKLAELYQLRVDLAVEPGDKVSLLSELAELQEKQLMDAEGAMASLSAAFVFEPGDSTLLAELERLTKNLGAWPAFVAVLEKVLAEPAAKPLDTTQARELGILAARCYDTRLGDALRAEEKYRIVLGLEPENTEVLAALEALLRQVGNSEALVPILRQRAAAEFDLDLKKKLLSEAARVARDELGQADVAASCYQGILELDEASTFALDALAQIREDEEKWEELADILMRRARFCEDVAEGVALRHKVATLQAGPLDQPDRAIDTYREILDSDPNERVALAALEQLLVSQEKWLDLQEVLVRRLDSAESDADRVAIRLRQAQLAETQFNSVDDAADAYRAVLEIDPGHAEASAGIERILSEAERWEDLVDMLERRAQLANNAGRADEELQLLVRIGEIWEQRLSNEVSAIEIYEKVLAREPNHTRALGALARLHESAGDWDRCASVLEQAASSGGPSDEVADVWFRLGRLNRDQRSDADAAEQCFWKAVDLDPQHGDAVVALRSILETKGDQRKIAELLERQEQATAEPAAKVAMLRDIGEIYLKRLEDAPRAVPFLERARVLDAHNRDVLLMLVDVYLGAGRQSDAVPVLRGLIEAELAAGGGKGARSKDLAVYHHRLGQALQAAGDREGAKAEFEAAYKIDLGNVDVLASLGKLRYEDGELEQAMKVFRGLLLQRSECSTMSKADIYYLMGDIYMQQNDPRRALGMFQRGLEGDKNHEGCKRMVEELKAAK